jgi:beta-lactamase regulating signal transducer with metallopeptidase domain
MDTLLYYLIKSVLISGLLTGYYFLVLRNRRFHAYNRAYLLGTLVISLVLPWVHFNWSLFSGKTSEPLSKVITRIDYPGPAATAAFYRYLETALVLIVLIGLALLIILVVNILQIRRLKAKNPCRKMADYLLIETDEPAAPFSFLNNLFWKRDADFDDPINQKILQHELAHIRGRHTWDILFVQAVNSLFWINPFFWFIRRELAMIHEFIADTASGVEGDTESFARMLLQSRLNHPSNTKHYLEPIHCFFHSPIKRRLIMITNNTRPTRSMWRKAIALPVILALIVLFSCSKDQQLAQVSPPPPPPQVARVILTAAPSGSLHLISFKSSPLIIKADGKNSQFQGEKNIRLQGEKFELTSVPHTNPVQFTISPKIQVDSANRIGIQ